MVLIGFLLIATACLMLAIFTERRDMGLFTLDFWKVMGILVILEFGIAIALLA